MTRLVAVDIGGTHARFAFAEVEGGRVVHLGEPMTLRTSDTPNLNEAWTAFAAAAGPVPEAAAIAVAAPVIDGRAKLTNNSWEIDPATLGLSRCILINDFAAVAHAVAQAGEAHFAHLCGREAALPSEGVISIIGPGTGLGIAHLSRDGDGYRTTATEGGHIGFAPADEFDDALLARLRALHGRVSVERVVCGAGLREIYAILTGRSPAADDKALWAAGLSGNDPDASAAIDRFCLSLGRVAGDIALAQGGAGVVIAGGLGLRIGDRLKHSQFAEGFCAKGRFAALMAGLPVKLITHPQPGLFGAAAAFAKEFA